MLEMLEIKALIPWDEGYEFAGEGMARLYEVRKEQKYLDQAERMAVFRHEFGFDQLPLEHSHGYLSSEFSLLLIHALTGKAKYPLAPQYVPLDEEHPQLPQDCYGLSKIVNEMTADMFYRREQMQIVSMRFSAILVPEYY